MRKEANIHDRAYNRLQQYIKNAFGLGLKDQAQASMRRVLRKEEITEIQGQTGLTPIFLGKV